MTLYEATFLCYLRAWYTIWRFYLACMCLYIQLKTLRGEF